MPRYGKFGGLLSRFRVEAGFEKQQDLAIRMGCRQQSVSRWEAGTSRPRSDELPKLARLLKLDDASVLYRACEYMPRSSPVPSDVSLEPGEGTLSGKELVKLWRRYHSMQPGETEGLLELNERGEFVVRPGVSKGYRTVQTDIAYQLRMALGSRVRLGQPVVTLDFGIRVPSVIWTPEARGSETDFPEVLPFAPEVCVDVVNAACLPALRHARVEGYLKSGAHEVILVDMSGGIEYWTETGMAARSTFGLTLKFEQG